MRQSLRETYQTFYSSRDSKSVSPTTGRLHKMRESFGPTVCLISKNPEPEPTADADRMRILMLILEVERLNRVVGILGGELKNQTQRVDLGQESEVEFLRKHTASMKATVEQMERDKYDEIDRLNKVIYGQNNRISEYETEISLAGRRLRQLQQQNQGLREQLRGTEVELQRARSEISRANLNLMMSSQTELQKSMVRQRSSAEAELWKEKLAKYQNMMNDQKGQILQQKRVIDRLNNSELELKQTYEYELSMLRKANEDLRDRQTAVERDAANRVIASQAEATRELGQKSREIQKLRDKIENMIKQNEGLKRQLDGLSRARDVEVEEMKRVIHELKESLEDLSADYSRQAQQLQNLKNENQMLRRQNTNLKSQLHSINQEYSVKIRNLKQQIQAKQQQASRTRKRRNLNTESRLRKSISEINLHSPRTRKPSDLNLSQLIMDVEALKSSNARITQLIDSKTRSQVIVQQRVQSYNSYGL